MKPVPLMNCKWINQPTSWSIIESKLDVTTNERTDFWRETYYSFIRDNGHFFNISTEESFTAELRFQAEYSHTYDQAGLMIRIDENNWIKTGVEFTDGKHTLSTVVTAEKSDWSVGTLDGNLNDVRLRVTLKGGAVRIQASTDGIYWPIFRVFSFPKCDSYLIGPMCCSPERGGFTVQFSEFTMGPPTLKDLHDLS